MQADVNNGTLRDTSGALGVNGQINGQNVSGTATVSYRPSLETVFTPDERIVTNLDRRIGVDGVIATFTGRDKDTTVAGSLVGTAN